MRTSAFFDLPESLRPDLRRAKVLSWITIGHLAVAVPAMWAVSGSSQAMRTALIEDLLSFLPPIAFLVAQRLARRRPSPRFPYGHHRAVTVGYLVGSLAILAMGVLLLIEGAASLARREHPTVGGIGVLGQVVWLGWPMIGVLLYSSLPMVFLGHLKIERAARLHDKALYADAEMNRADWLTGGAAILGVLGIGLGWWWADAVAAVIISLDVALDGAKNTKAALEDIMDREPRTVDHRKALHLDRAIEQRLREDGAVEQVSVRLRENGHVFFGDILASSVVGTTPELAHRCVDLAKQVDGRIHDLVVQLVDRNDPRLQEAATAPEGVVPPASNGDAVLPSAAPREDAEETPSRRSPE